MLVYEQETLVGAVNGVSAVMESLDRNAEIAAAAADSQSINNRSTNPCSLRFVLLFFFAHSVDR
jgi:hypothetical protein